MNTVVINEQSLSGHHCSISRRDDKVYLKDFSSNGTYVNDRKLNTEEEVEIQHRDIVWLLHPSRVTVEKTIGFTFLIEKKLKEEEERRLKGESLIEAR